MIAPAKKLSVSVLSPQSHLALSKILLKVQTNSSADVLALTTSELGSSEHLLMFIRQLGLNRRKGGRE